MSLMEIEDPRLFLSRLVERTRQSNPQYSQGALARKLGVSSAYLSLFLSGKKSLAKTRLVSIFKKHSLGLSRIEQKHLILINDLMKAKSSEQQGRIRRKIELNRENALARKVPLSLLERLMSWEAFWIKELISMKSRPCSIAWICDKTELPIAQVREVCESLALAGIVQFDRPKELVRVKHQRMVGYSAEANPFLKKLHLKANEKACEAILGQSPSERFSATELFSVRSKDLPKVRALLNDCLDEIQKLVHLGGERDQLYSITTHLFKVCDQRTRQS